MNVWKYNYQVIALAEVINSHIIDFSTMLLNYLTGIFPKGSLLCRLFLLFIIFVITSNLPPCYELNVCVPWYLCIEALTPNMMVFGGGALGTELGLDAIMRVVRALTVGLVFL